MCVGVLLDIKKRGEASMKLEIADVTFGYGKTIVIKDMNLELTPGVYGLLGPNGAGKSTLISLLVTNRIPDKGEICYRVL